MRLRFKLNLIAVGVCCTGALVGALANKPIMMTANIVLAIWNWITALAGEQEDKDAVS